MNDYGSTLTIEREQQTPRPIPMLRQPICQNRFTRLGLDMERAGTVCQGCRYNLKQGCPNTRAWSLDAETGTIKPVCNPETLVYCKHYDCGCDLCANALYGTPLPFVARE